MPFEASYLSFQASNLCFKASNLPFQTSKEGFKLQLEDFWLQNPCFYGKKRVWPQIPDSKPKEVSFEDRKGAKGKLGERDDYKNQHYSPRKTRRGHEDFRHCFVTTDFTVFNWLAFFGKTFSRNEISSKAIDLSAKPEHHGLHYPAN